MQSGALVLAICLTALYGYGAQATMAADLARARLAAAAVERAEPIWYGGTLDPVLVEAPAGRAALVDRPPTCEVDRPRG